jgi:hypothetical protein
MPKRSLFAKKKTYARSIPSTWLSGGREKQITWLASLTSVLFIFHYIYIYRHTLKCVTFEPYRQSWPHVNSRAVGWDPSATLGGARVKLTVSRDVTTGHR